MGRREWRGMGRRKGKGPDGCDTQVHTSNCLRRPPSPQTSVICTHRSRASDAHRKTFGTVPDMWLAVFVNASAGK